MRNRQDTFRDGVLTDDATFGKETILEDSLFHDLFSEISKDEFTRVVQHRNQIWVSPW